MSTAERNIYRDGSYRLAAPVRSQTPCNLRHLSQQPECAQGQRIQAGSGTRMPQALLTGERTPGENVNAEQ